MRHCCAPETLLEIDGGDQARTHPSASLLPSNDEIGGLLGQPQAERGMDELRWWWSRVSVAVVAARKGEY